MNTLREGTILQGKVYRYKIEKVLGQGTFGITYQASTPTKIQGPLGTIEGEMKVAVKEFFLRDINGRSGTMVTSGSQGGIFDQYKENFLREARNLSRMRHPHIVKVLGSFEANNTAYFVMELLTGGSLEARIKREGHLQESEALPILRDIGSALSYMHSSKMLHLDIKPQNVMLRDDGSAVVIDFGLSKQYDDNGNPETSTTVGMGTKGFAPTEQSDYRDGSGFPVTMDVYALGATLFKMLVGKTPPTASEVLNNRHLLADELREKGVSKSIISYIVKAMAPMVANRYPTVKAFMSALTNAVPSPSSRPIPVDDGTDYDDVVVAEVLSPNNNVYWVNEYKKDRRDTIAAKANQEIEIKPTTGMVRLDFWPETYDYSDNPQVQKRAFRVSITPNSIDPNYTQESTRISEPLSNEKYWRIIKELSQAINGNVHRVQAYQDLIIDEGNTSIYWPPRMRITLYDKNLIIYDELWSYGDISGNIRGDISALEQQIRGIIPFIGEYLASSYHETPEFFSLPTIENNKAQKGYLSGKEKETDENLSFTVKGVSFKMIRVKGGTFMMGATSEQGEDAHDWKKTVHQVTLSDYSMGETEVTQALWQAVMGKNPSWFKGDANRPVESVSWNDCQEFIKRLNQLTGCQFRLPTEAEWEYAARGGSMSCGTKYAGSNDIGSVAWYDKNACDGVGKNNPDYGTHVVKTKSPNELGLYDMSGNVWEWCQDWKGDYSSSAQTNPQGPTCGSRRVRRGGSWRTYAKSCRVSNRGYDSSGHGDPNLGLRLAL